MTRSIPPLDHQPPAGSVRLSGVAAPSPPFTRHHTQPYLRLHLSRCRTHIHIFSFLRKPNCTTTPPPSPCLFSTTTTHTTSRKFLVDYSYRAPAVCYDVYPGFRAHSFMPALRRRRQRLHGPPPDGAMPYGIRREYKCMFYILYFLPFYLSVSFRFLFTAEFLLSIVKHAYCLTLLIIFFFLIFSACSALASIHPSVHPRPHSKNTCCTRASLRFVFLFPPLLPFRLL